MENNVKKIQKTYRMYYRSVIKTPTGETLGLMGEIRRKTMQSESSIIDAAVKNYAELCCEKGNLRLVVPQIAFKSYKIAGDKVDSRKIIRRSYSLLPTTIEILARYKSELGLMPQDTLLFALYTWNEALRVQDGVLVILSKRDQLLGLKKKPKSGDCDITESI